MGLSYLNDKNWSDITREERFFCAELYHAIKGNETGFVRWLSALDSMKTLRLDPDKYWEVAFEVSFYRDLFKSYEVSNKENDFSDQRTFDLCLFSEDQIVVIEAKSQGQFDSAQNEEFEKDKSGVSGAIKLVAGKEADIEVNLIALASSQYFDNVEIYGADKRIPDVFDGYFSWKDISGSFSPQDVFLRADNIYKK